MTRKWQDRGYNDAYKLIEAKNAERNKLLRRWRRA